jgi:hypothetical protein
MGTFSIDCGGTPKPWAVVTKHLLAGSDWFHHSERQEAVHMPCQVQRGGMLVLHHLHVDFETSAYEDECVTSRTSKYEDYIQRGVHCVRDIYICVPIY